ncbi:nucleoside phosphorylase domain-containing protein [Mycena leptocephala]|nr:nucleoside phosphorylase domain-containing protein [Mycena leptocephala]
MRTPFFSHHDLLFLLVLWWLLSAHSISPSESAIPVRTNFAALKHLGVRVIIAFSAVGGLREEIGPSTLLCLRSSSNAPRAFQQPVLAASRCLARRRRASAQGRRKGREAVDEEEVGGDGEPAGGDLTGMTALPEAKLVREAEISFALITTWTDYEAWRLHEVGVTTAEAYENAALAYVLPEYFKAP